MIIYSQKYYTKYNQIVKHYKDLDLKKSKAFDTEIHHITPKSMGGDNSKENLVRVTARVHFLLHWMLCRIYRTKEMAYAWNMMCVNHTNGKRYNGKSYEYARKLFGYCVSIRQTGTPLSSEHKRSISESNKGRRFTDDHRNNISNSKKGKIHSAQSRANMAESKKGKTHTNETKAKMSLSRRGTKCSAEVRYNMAMAQQTRLAVSCPYCTKTGKANMKRWHFDKCKYKTIEEISL